MLKPALVTAPAVALFTTAEIKTHSKVDYDDEDGLIDAYVAAATAHIDGYSGILGRALINQTWRQDFSSFSSCLRLPIEPVSAISSVKYYDTDNAIQTLDASKYTLLTDSQGAFVMLSSGSSWPASYSRPDAVSIEFVAGYGPAASDVPAPILQAVRMMVSTWLENRETTVIGVSVNEMPANINAMCLLDSYRTRRVS